MDKLPVFDSQPCVGCYPGGSALEVRNALIQLEKLKKWSATRKCFVNQSPLLLGNKGRPHCCDICRSPNPIARRYQFRMLASSNSESRNTHQRVMIAIVVEGFSTPCSLLWRLLGGW